MSQFDHLTCDETFRLLDDYLDRELSSEEQRLVEEHLKVCAACAEDFTFEAEILREIRAKIDRIDLPEGLMDKILKRLDKNG